MEFENSFIKSYITIASGILSILIMKIASYILLALDINDSYHIAEFMGVLGLSYFMALSTIRIIYTMLIVVARKVIKSYEKKR